MQGESLGGSPGLIFVNRSITYRYIRNLVSIYSGRCDDNWVTEDAETGFLRLETQADTKIYVSG
jgi:hypothetical protein